MTPYYQFANIISEHTFGAGKWINILPPQNVFQARPILEKLLTDPAYQGKVAWAIYAGVVKYFAQGGVPALEPSEKEKVIKTFKEQAPGSISEP